jgi:hypothetical protein
VRTTKSHRIQRSSRMSVQWSSPAKPSGTRYSNQIDRDEYPIYIHLGARWNLRNLPLFKLSKRPPRRCSSVDPLRRKKRQDNAITPRSRRPTGLRYKQDAQQDATSRPTSWIVPPPHASMANLGGSPYLHPHCYPMVSPRVATTTMTKGTAPTT